MIEVNHISKSYGQVQALDGLSLSIEPEQCYGLLGPNGAGKSTALNILNTLIKPDSGHVSLFGFDLVSQNTQCKQITGMVPQDIALYGDLSAWDNLLFWASINGLNRKQAKERAEKLMKRVELWTERKRALKTFSGGMKRRINIIASLLHQPKLLLLDEPTVGIDPHNRATVYELVEELKKDGITIIYTSHYIEEMERLCDKLAIINLGKILEEGSVAEIKKKSKQQQKMKVSISNWSEQLRHVVPEGFEVVHSGQQVALYTALNEGSNGEIVQNLQLIESLNEHISNIEILKPNLESVFLELTGSTLSE